MREEATAIGGSGCRVSRIGARSCGYRAGCSIDAPVTTPSTDIERLADELACLLLGLAAGLRIFRLLDPRTTNPDLVVAEYGALIRQVIDRLGDAGQGLTLRG